MTVCSKPSDIGRVVRFWNFIPGILDSIDNFDQRYKVFNMGRFNAFSRWFGGNGEFGHQIATASGIGTTGSGFAVHALSTSNPAEPVENPRQIPSYRYSKNYGPLPPCFARAMRVIGGTERLLVVEQPRSVEKRPFTKAALPASLMKPSSTSQRLLELDWEWRMSTAILRNTTHIF